ncbi:hypothetical protein [Candidatus Mycalebacterium sp.]
MIKVNLIKTGESRKPRRAAIVAALCICLVAVSFPYLKSGFGEADHERPVVTAALKTPSAPHKKQREVKHTSTRKLPLKVAGFVKFADRNFAMLVSGSRVLWVEPGQTAFGFNIAKVKEEGISAEKGSKTVFVPFGK